jgi:hypothetical protein
MAAPPVKPQARTATQEQCFTADRQCLMSRLVRDGQVLATGVQMLDQLTPNVIAWKRSPTPFDPGNGKCC